MNCSMKKSGCLSILLDFRFRDIIWQRPINTVLVLVNSTCGKSLHIYIYMSIRIWGPLAPYSNIYIYICIYVYMYIYIYIIFFPFLRATRFFIGHCHIYILYMYRILTLGFGGQGLFLEHMIVLQSLGLLGNDIFVCGCVLFSLQKCILSRGWQRTSYVIYNRSPRGQGHIKYSKNGFEWVKKHYLNIIF